ncbi:Dipeptidyl-peptidase 5 [Coemansia sp. RSA 1646]|nr:Dipeptidyl-peptidase 5 [Coemansia sp. RSA 1646]KAJ2085602.1 dipeptidylpeptidase [Coemansia sp. RSA 986]
MKIADVATLCVLGWATASAAGQNDTGAYEGNTKPLDIRLFHSLNRAGPAVVSPDSKKLLFTQSHYDQDENETATYISVVDVVSGATSRLTPDIVGQSYTNPLWFDDQTFGYVHNGSLYQQQLKGGVNGTAVYKPAVSFSSVAYRQGYLTFVASVYPNTTSLKESKKWGDLEKKKIDSAQLFDDLWVRHWDEWMTLKKPNVFAVPVNQTSKRDDDDEGYEGYEWTVGNEVNLMKGLPAFHDPLIRWSAEEYTVDKQGRNVAFVVRNPSDDMSSKTDVDIYLVPINGTSNPTLLTGNVSGIAGGPAFSPDGKRLAWLQMETPAYESDINRIYVHDIDAGSTISVSRDWNLSPMGLLWSADGKAIYTVTGDKGNNVVYAVDVATGRRQRLTERGTASGVRLLGSDKLVLMHSDQDKCTNIHVLDPDKQAMRQLTDVNRRKLSGIYVGSAEDFWFEGARGDQVHGWLVKPPGFDAQKKYPLAYIVHGGPQQHNAHGFSYAQWNPNMYASAGFVTVQINFHGSSSYGQNFTDSIARQWGGYPYDDLMKGLDHVLATYGFVDPKRMVALGASYGGYMMNWFNAQTDRFAALVCHDGMFSTPAFWYSTEELWFPEHDFGGVPYNSEARRNYEEFNPERFAANFSTPTLFIQGAKDFRLTVEQSLAPFTLLRRKGVQARLMYFADENHWTTHTGNSVRWYTEVFRWISEHTNTTLPYELEL